ncbi:MAG: lytic transglycosylase domain-containing protein [Mesonia hippocampi]|uniref:lytic transglycosylase domain-containing protein n=1 Tax=Mesonia hippocampi TaxID=1628250 RepID=UPI003F9BE622
MEFFKNALLFVGLAAIVGILMQAVNINTTKAPEASHVEKSPADTAMVSLVKDYNVYALPIPQSINFAGEPVPVENPDIKERLDREFLVNTYWQSNGLLLVKRAHKYFPIIEPILEKNGIPDDFKYLAIAESGLMQVVSPAGATGVWQIMKATGREYGLEINDNVDERYHIEKATEVACQYLKEAKEKFGSWTLAAASYNAGRAGIERQQERQEVEDYYDLLLNTETGRYVFRIVALKEILSNPAKYGFNFTEKDMYQYIPTKEISVDTAVTNFASFAKEFGINYKILKIHNPWLREAHLNNKSRKTYQLKIPQKGYYTYNPES